MRLIDADDLRLRKELRFGLMAAITTRMNILKLERSIALLKPIIWKMPMNEKRDAYITLLTAAQKQLPQEVNLVVEEHFIPNCPFPQQIPKGWACPVCGREVDDAAHYCKFCGQAICDD